MALPDLLVGAASMPLSITLDTLVIQRVFPVDIICTIEDLGVLSMDTICGASVLHLLLIAWEMYVAIAECMEYKTIVTGRRVKRYTRIARLSAVIIVVPFVAATAVNLPNEIVLVNYVILSIFWFVCSSLIAYFYIKVYLAA